MAVMTSHLPSPLDVYSKSDSISPSTSSQVLSDRRSLKSLLANPASKPGSSFSENMIQKSAQLAGSSRSSVQPLPSSRHRTNSISASATSPVRPSPRFHVANPTELPPSPPSSSKILVAGSSRPLPAPTSCSEGTTSRPPSPPRIHINTSVLHAQSPPSLASPFTLGSSSTAPSTSSSTGSFIPKHMSKNSLPFGPQTSQITPSSPLLSDASFHSGRTTPVSALPSPSSISASKAGVRPLPAPPPPLPKSPGASISGPRPRSSSRGPSSSKARSRTNSAASRGDAKPQLAFDPTSSSYVIRTASDVHHGHISAPPMPSGSSVFVDKPRRHTHDRSRSAQFKNFSSMGLPDTRDISEAPLTAKSLDSSSKMKGIRSAPTSDSEEFLSRQSISKSRKSRPRLVLFNPSDDSPPINPNVRSAPTSDTEESLFTSTTSTFHSPSSSITSATTAEFTSPLLLPPTGSIKDMLPQISQPITSPKSASRTLPVKPVRQIPPQALSQRGGVRVLSPPPLPPLSEDIGYADPGYVEDLRVYVDDGYDGSGGLGAFSASIDPDVDLDVGEMVFSSRPPSGEFMGPSVTDLDMDVRGRRASRPAKAQAQAQTARWRSEDPRGTTSVADPIASADGLDLQQRRQSHSQSAGKTLAHSKSTSSSKRLIASRSSSQTVTESGLKSPVRPLPEVELGPVPIDMDLEPEMVFSKNPTATLTPAHSTPGVLDTSERVYVRGKWRSPSPSSPEAIMNRRPLQRHATSGQFAPVRARGFYDDWK